MARMLLIDDDSLFREATASLLLAQGFDVLEAADGNSGIEIFRRCPDCIVFCDIFMSGKEGFETIRDLRKDYPNAKIIAMSVGDNRSKIDVFKIALLMGANVALRKPFDRDTLASVIERVIEMQAVAS